VCTRAAADPDLAAELKEHVVKRIGEEKER
jgi:hypothetical protein